MIRREIAACHDVEFFAHGEDDVVVVVHFGASFGKKLSVYSQFGV